MRDRKRRTMASRPVIRIEGLMGGRSATPEWRKRIKELKAAQEADQEKDSASPDRH